MRGSVVSRLAGGTVLAAVCMLIVASTAYAAGGREPARTIAVVGYGEIRAQPDVAWARVGMVTASPDIEEALSANRERSARVRARLLELGLSEADISTEGYNVYRHMRPGPASDGDEGEYRVMHSYRVSIPDIARTGELVDAAVDAGANEIGGVTFGIRDASSYERIARTRALEAAEKQAEEMAGAMGLTVGSVVEIRSTDAGMPSPPFESMPARGHGGGIEPGELTVREGVRVVFELR